MPSTQIAAGFLFVLVNEAILLLTYAVCVQTYLGTCCRYMHFVLMLRDAIIRICIPSYR